jgi:hypothetical protein
MFKSVKHTPALAQAEQRTSRKRHVPDILSKAAEDVLANTKWQNVSWRTGTKGRLKARFTAVRVRTADGPPQRIKDKGQQHLPGDDPRDGDTIGRGAAINCPWAIASCSLREARSASRFCRAWRSRFSGSISSSNFLISAFALASWSSRSSRCFFKSAICLRLKE